MTLDDVGHEHLNWIKRNIIRVMNVVCESAIFCGSDMKMYLIMNNEVKDERMS